MLEIEHRAMEEIEQQARVWLSHRPVEGENPYRALRNIRG